MLLLTWKIMLLFNVRKEGFHISFPRLPRLGRHEAENFGFAVVTDEEFPGSGGYVCEAVGCTNGVGGGVSCEPGGVS